jgi:hypothetical protein
MRPPPSLERLGRVEGTSAIVDARDDNTPLRDHDKQLTPGLSGPG